MGRSYVALVFGLLGLTSLVGCDYFTSNPDPDVGLPDGALPDGALPDGALPDGALPDGGGLPGSVGSDCVDASGCRMGLICADDSTCQPSGTVDMGSPCQLTGDCMGGLFCSATTRVCEEAGEGEDGAECTSAGDCVAGLSCIIEGFGARCRPGGAGDIGTPCMNETGCISGLVCVPVPGAGSLCTDPPVGTIPPFPVPAPWSGEECVEETGPARALFDVPRGTAEDGDFYRLPYPNDVRRTTSGNLDLTGYPTPDTALPIDIIDRYARASEEDLTGFSTNPVSYFRFSQPYDWDSIDGKFRLVNITPDSPSYGQTVPLQWQVTAGRVTKYMCEDWFAFRPRHGDPLQPGETYAAVLDRGFMAESGTTFDRSDDFAAMLADGAPSDASLAAAHAAYAPLRAWIADDDEVVGANMLVAAVFTTQEPETLIPKLREVIRAQDAPVISDLTLCDDGVVSPCDDGTEQRACGAVNPAYFELHGRIRLPIFQQGTAPYLTPEDGGGIEVDSSGNPTIARSEDVCFAMTVPRVAPPEDGFPLMIHGHGTGGSFAGVVRGGLSADVAGNDEGGAPVQAVTFAIDYPEHGARRGDSTEDPDLLFFNFTNPRAARDNVTQGAADLMSQIYWATTYALDAGESPTAEEIRFNADRIVLFVHSQGATHASPMFPYEPDVHAVLLSGNGGDLTQSLLTKTEPVDIASVLPFALLDANRDGNLSAGRFHPALALFQAYFDRVDSVNYARRVHRAPVEGLPSQHVFMTYGLGDRFSTEQTMSAYGLAARLPMVTPLLTDAFGPMVDGPVSNNLMIGEEMYTVALRQYDPTAAGVDGHFVSTRTDEGRADALRFVRDALQGEVPVIGAP